MLKSKNLALFVATLLLFAIVLVACQPETVEVQVPVEVTRVVTETVEVEGEAVEVTRVVTETVEVEVPAEGEAMEEVSMNAPDPTVYTQVVFGDIDTMDPALAYDTASGGLLRNVMEPLIYPNYTDPNNFVPLLAVEVPTVDNGGISADGLTYTFQMREGVTFHNGNDMTASDAAYTFQRGLLQSDPNGPQWLLLEPILGYTSGDVTEEIADGAYAGDPDGLVANATPEELAAVCEKVQAAVVADDAAGTLTFNLAMPWGPFLATISQSWGSIMDKEWAVENGAWDGDCATWQDFYAPGSADDELSTIINGTGPYMLQNWTPGEGWTLVANPNYWRADGDAIWENGPSGAPVIQTVNNQIVDEWGTRFAMLQAGDAASVSVNPDNRPQADTFVGEFCDYKTMTCETNPDNPNGPLRKWGGLPQPSRTDVFMTFNIPPDSPYIGSGQLDGNGIPTDFFNDIHVRKAMNYCFDYDTYIAEALNGEGVRNNGPIILDMLGYNPDGEMYPYDLDQCAAELEQAWDGVLPETGFRFQMGFNTGNSVRQTAGEILQANLASINPLYQVDIVGMPWPTLLRSFRASQLPMIASGWIEDIHDPHNWVQPFTVGTYAGRQAMDPDLRAQFQELVNAGVATADPAERAAVYYELQVLHHDQAPQITLAQVSGVRYEQRWVNDWYFLAGQSLDYPYYYALGLE
ncbi:MAG: ABC transporter substrate-binding protein [Anaerolineales bacterium]|nr:ABC transporter substrate-binding protein [Anaerolineales bacterium]MCA9928565.1 ABC transporter substrate-binding protein [Anaerolineales bacterium]